jgi:branched-chain amino acid transport system permease protein
VAGATLYVVLKELVWVNFINFHSAILGIIIIAVVYVLPGGVLRLIDLLWRKRSTVAQPRYAK